MKRTAVLIITVLPLLTFTTVRAEVVSLICEHDGGVNVSTGLPNFFDDMIFEIAIDVEAKTATQSINTQDEFHFNMNENTIFWVFSFPSAGQRNAYSLNRYSGTLFVQIQNDDEDRRYVAQGTCIKKAKKLL